MPAVYHNQREIGHCPEAQSVEVVEGGRAGAAPVANPVKATPAAVNLGRIYYGYYCAHCHGPGGRGDGTVGRSFVPDPPALTGARVQAMSDSALAWDMIVGPGHEPVMAAPVPLARRWCIAHHLRSNAGANPRTGQAALASGNISRETGHGAGPGRYSLALHSQR